VFGSAALTIFAVQVVTGILLALVYVPSAGDAWNSLQALNHQLTLGWFLRGLHGWGSNFMVAVVLIHMIQVFLFGAYKFPRELTWIVGVLLLLVTLGWRSRARCFASIRMPTGDSASAPRSRAVCRCSDRGSSVYCWAVRSSPAHAVALFRAARLPDPRPAHRVRRRPRSARVDARVNEWPMPGRIVRRETYMQEYHDTTHRDGVPFVPYAVGKDIVFSSAIVAAICVCAAVLGPFGPSGPPDPTIIQAAPRPISFFSGSLRCSLFCLPRPKRRSC